MSALDARLISTMLEDIASTPEAQASGMVGGEPSLAAWLFLIRQDVLNLPWSTPAQERRRRGEIVTQLSAAVAAAPAQAEQIQAVLDRFQAVTS